MPKYNPTNIHSEYTWEEARQGVPAEHQDGVPDDAIVNIHFRTNDPEKQSEFTVTLYKQKPDSESTNDTDQNQDQPLASIVAVEFQDNDIVNRRVEQTDLPEMVYMKAICRNIESYIAGNDISNSPT